MVDGKRLWPQAVPLLKSEMAERAPGPTLTIAGTATPADPGRADCDAGADQWRQGSVWIAAAPVGFRRLRRQTRPSGTGTISRARTLRGQGGVCSINDPDFEGGAGDFGGKAMTSYGRWTYKYEEGARQGLKGVLVVHETVPATYGWATVKNSNTKAKFDIVRRIRAAEHPLLGAGSSAMKQRSCSPGRAPGSKRSRPPRKRKDFRPVAAQGGARRATVTGRPRSSPRRTCSACARQHISRRNGDLHGRTGITSASARPTPRATDLQRSDRQRHRHRCS